MFLAANWPFFSYSYSLYINNSTSILSNENTTNTIFGGRLMFFLHQKAFIFIFQKQIGQTRTFCTIYIIDDKSFSRKVPFIFETKQWSEFLMNRIWSIWTDSSGTKLFWINSICSKIGLILPTHKLINHFDMQEILIRTWIEVFKLRLVYILAQVGP